MLTVILTRNVHTFIYSLKEDYLISPKNSFLFENRREVNEDNMIFRNTSAELFDNAMKHVREYLNHFKFNRNG